MLFNFNDDELNTKLVTMFIKSKLDYKKGMIEYTEALPPENRLEVTFMKYEDGEAAKKDYRRMHRAIRKFYKSQEEREEGNSQVIGYMQPTSQEEHEDDGEYYEE